MKTTQATRHLFAWWIGRETTKSFLYQFLCLISPAVKRKRKILNSVSYQKKDGCGHAHPFHFFWFDNDSGHFWVMVWQWLQTLGTFAWWIGWEKPVLYHIFSVPVSMSNFTSCKCRVKRHDTMFNETTFISFLSRFPLRVSAYNFLRVYYETVYCKSTKFREHSEPFPEHSECVFCSWLIRVPNGLEKSRMNEWMNCLFTWVWFDKYIHYYFT